MITTRSYDGYGSEPLLSLSGKWLKIDHTDSLAYFTDTHVYESLKSWSPYSYVYDYASYSSLQIGNGDIIDITWSIDDGVPLSGISIPDESETPAIPVDYTEEQPDIAPDDLTGLILHMDRTSINYLSEGGPTGSISEVEEYYDYQMVKLTDRVSSP